MKCITLILIFFCLLSAVQASPRFVARIDNPALDTFTRFQNLGFDICAYHPGKYLDILLDDALMQSLIADFPSLHVTQTEAQLKANLLPERDIPGYRDYQEMLDDLLLLQAQYPALVQLSQIGETWGAQYAATNSAYQNFNQQLWAIKLSDNVATTEDEPAFYFVGAHHAREPISMETVMGILNHLLDGYGTNNQITNIVDNNEIWFVPLLNPNGHKIVIDQTDVWWRKNLHDNNGNNSIDIGSNGYGPDGIDLNRNYGYKWGYLNASGDPTAITYHGTEAFSELETQSFRDFLESRKFLAGISYHTYGQYVLYPFGYMYDIISPDATELQALANAMAATITTVDGSDTYSPMPSYDLYPVSGSLDDWAYGTQGIFAYTIEMASQFIPPATQVPGIVDNNINAAMLMLNRTSSKILTGHVTDAITGEALSAMVFIDGIDDNILKTSQYWTNPQFGSFRRFLPVGTYRVSYICPGYQSEVRTVQINNQTPTIEDIALLSVEALNLQVNILGIQNEALSGAILNFTDLEEGSYTADANGQVSIPNFYPGIYRYTISIAGSEQLQRMEYIQGPVLRITLTNSPGLVHDFETDLSAWQSTGSWGRSSNQHYSGAYSLSDSPGGNYPNNANSTCKLLQPINLQGVLNANLQFYAKYNIALDGDYCELAYSTTGTNWKYFTHFNGSSDWQLFSFNLNHLIGSQVYFRFSLSSTSQGTSDGIFIDDFKVFSSSNPTPVDEAILPLPILNLNLYPNPFSSQLQIALEGKSPQPVQVAVYNLKGQLVKVLFSGAITSEKQLFAWDGRDASAGICANGLYIIRMSQQGKTLQSQKTILMK